MDYNKNIDKFLIASAICSFLGALTTALLIFLPNPEASDFETSNLLYSNSLYLSKLWILFFHPQVNLLASLGIAYLMFRKYPFEIIFGTFFLLIWAFTEMSQQSLLIDALNQIWRPGYVGAPNESEKIMFTILIKAANGISDSNYFLVIYGFGLGSLFYGFAFIKEVGWSKWLGMALIFIGLLSLASFARYYAGMHFFLSGIVNWSYEWIYPYLQPIVRISLGIWILKNLKSGIDSIKTSQNKC